MDIEKGSVWVKFNTMESFMRDVFIGLGVPKKEAVVSAEVLIMADKLGFDSHGISASYHSSSSVMPRLNSSTLPFGM